MVATAAANLPRTRACAADLVGDFLAMEGPRPKKHLEEPKGELVPADRGDR